jgi:hypothetical protein
MHKKCALCFIKAKKGAQGIGRAWHCMSRGRAGRAWHCMIAQGAHGIACREVAHRSMQFDRHVARSNVECPSGPTADAWDISLSRVTTTRDVLSALLPPQWGVENGCCKFARSVQCRSGSGSRRFAWTSEVNVHSSYPARSRAHVPSPAPRLGLPPDSSPHAVCMQTRPLPRGPGITGAAARLISATTSADCNSGDHRFEDPSGGCGRPRLQTAKRSSDTLS